MKLFKEVAGAALGRGASRRRANLLKEVIPAPGALWSVDLEKAFPTSSALTETMAVQPPRGVLNTLRRLDDDGPGVRFFERELKGRRLYVSVAGAGHMRRLLLFDEAGGILAQGSYDSDGTIRWRI